VAVLFLAAAAAVILVALNVAGLRDRLVSAGDSKDRIHRRTTLRISRAIPSRNTATAD
jgi:hypothetical protein